MLISKLRFMVLIIVFLWAKTLGAQEFPLPKAGSDIVGEIQNIVVHPGDNFAAIAQHFNVTYTGLVEANPGVNPQAPRPGTVLIVPSAYILPDVSRKGIVINLAELRLYYYPKHEKVVYTYPIGIGIRDWTVPLGAMKIIEKKKDPTWYVPDSVYKELHAKGFDVPHQIPPGPDNPLGGYMLRLSQRTFLIHGVVDPTTVGRRSSSGCIRMYPEDIVQVFNMVPVGTPVRIINEPYKIGWNSGELYLEAHIPLQEQQVAQGNDLSPLVNVVSAATENKSIDINWDRAFTLSKQAMGLPEQIGARG